MGTAISNTISFSAMVIGGATAGAAAMAGLTRNVCRRVDEVNPESVVGQALQANTRWVVMVIQVKDRTFSTLSSIASSFYSGLFLEEPSPSPSQQALPDAADSRFY